MADNTVSVINGATNAVVATVPVGNAPEGVGVNATTGFVYVSNASDNTVSVINGATNVVVATVSVGNDPEGVGVNATTGFVYVSNAADNNVSVINGAANAVLATVPVGVAPIDVGVNAATDHVYVANYVSNNVSVIGDADISLAIDFATTDDTSTSVGTIQTCLEVGSGQTGIPLDVVISSVTTGDRETNYWRL